MIFVNSMSDLFHKEIPNAFIGSVFDTMERAHWHTFQILTKRSSLMRNFLRRRYGDNRGPSHMWFGVSVEDGSRKSRIRHLQDAPAGVRFLSIEPLIGPVGTLDLTGIDWVIVGGESGPRRATNGARVGARGTGSVPRQQGGFLLQAVGRLTTQDGRAQARRSGVEPIPRDQISILGGRRVNMVSLADYAGREQSYVKHVLLESYLEKLVHKVASRYDQIAYVDGFAGPWLSANERFEDTSFGIALSALRRAKATWKQNSRDVRMSAFLVERDKTAYSQLAQVPARYPDVTIKTHCEDFLKIVPTILREIAPSAFVFFLIDPKGWRVPLNPLAPLLARPNSEVIFNFMFDFINRAASINEPKVVAGLDELIPFGNWRAALAEGERNGGLSPEERNEILVTAFSDNLRQIGNYGYVAETAVLRPQKIAPCIPCCTARAARRASRCSETARSLRSKSSRARAQPSR
jgi:three-Cys-motif partner protein